MCGFELYPSRDVPVQVEQAAPIAPSTTLFSRLGRTQVVWLSLLAAMTATGGGLVALEGRRAPRADGIALAAPVRAAEAPSLESVFKTRMPLNHEAWKRIVIHHSGASFGSPESVAAAHEARRLRGLGYHFVIGNGSGSGDGELYVGFRWLDQQPGAHAMGAEGEWHNLHSIGICLIGDGDRKPFTEAQMRRLSELVSALSREFGIAERDVVLHNQIAPTTSPGRLFQDASLRQRLASLGVTPETASAQAR